MQLKLSQRASLQVSTDLNALIDVLSWFDQFQNSLLPYDVWLQCQLAVAEGFTNAVRHAHRDKPVETPVDLEVEIRDDILDIRIWDRGPGFDLDSHLKNHALPVDESAEGGRGLTLIHRIADTLSYTCVDGERNCLHISKRF
ncbi:MAG: anti-sigma regulatory factor [Leptolyngbyaceae bacterium]|nr:anti-sigma regulatory factor [Leptolyngbyaceae bacterium]